jgi:hypothetical protein
MCHRGLVVAGLCLMTMTSSALADALKKELRGDLPEGAIARLARTYFRHGIKVKELTLSPDGRFLATVENLFSSPAL